MLSRRVEQIVSDHAVRWWRPGLRAQETNARNQIQALDTQLADRDAYLKLADDLDGFLTQLRGNAHSTEVVARQRVLRPLVKNVLIGPAKITIQHSIPTRPRPSEPTTDTEGDHQPNCPLRRGVISPLLLNVALHGMEEAAGVRTRKSGISAGMTREGSPVLIKYADDLVAICVSQQQATEVKAKLAQWLAPCRVARARSRLLLW